MVVKIILPSEISTEFNHIHSNSVVTYNSSENTNRALLVNTTLSMQSMFRISNICYVYT